MQGCYIKDSITQTINVNYIFILSSYRLQTLGWLETCLTATIMSLKVEGFLLSGQLQRYISTQVMHNNFVVLASACTHCITA